MGCRAYVVHYGDPAATRRTITSLRAGDVVPDKLVVVDNQGDFALEGVEVVRAGGNIGFAAAIVLGSIDGLRAGADWLWFLNNDAEVAPGCLAALLTAGDAEPSAALLSPVIEHEGGDIWYAGGMVDPHSMRVGHATGVLAAEPYETGYVTGCTILARATFVREAGPTDARLFMYFEDADWSLRARSCGWRALVVPDARVRHSVERRGGRRVWSPLAVYLLTRNRLLLARRWGSVTAALRPATAWGLRQVIKAMVWGTEYGTAAALVTGLRDGLAGRSGAPPARLFRKRS